MVEAVPEDETLKRSIFHSLDQVGAAEAISIVACLACTQEADGAC